MPSLSSFKGFKSGNNKPLTGNGTQSKTGYQMPQNPFKPPTPTGSQRSAFKTQNPNFFQQNTSKSNYNNVSFNPQQQQNHMDMPPQNF